MGGVGQVPRFRVINGSSDGRGGGADARAPPREGGGRGAAGR